MPPPPRISNGPSLLSCIGINNVKVLSQQMAPVVPACVAVHTLVIELVFDTHNIFVFHRNCQLQLNLPKTNYYSVQISGSRK